MFPSLPCSFAPFIISLCLQSCASFTIYVTVEYSPALVKLENVQLFSTLFSRHQLMTGAVWITCVLLWCFYQLFGLSIWRHPFTAELPLLSKWWNATFLQICSDEETNSSKSWMAWVLENIVHFDVSVCLNLFSLLVVDNLHTVIY